MGEDHSNPNRTGVYDTFGETLKRSAGNGGWRGFINIINWGEREMMEIKTGGGERGRWESRNDRRGFHHRRSGFHFGRRRRPEKIKTSKKMVMRRES